MMLFKRMFTARFRPILSRLGVGRYSNGATFKPYLPRQIDTGELLRRVRLVYGLDTDTVESLWQTYRAFHAKKDYAQRLGERKTFCFEEAFILYVALTLVRPPTIIEIGTQYGKSTRRLIDMKNLCGLKAKVICFDILDQVEYFTPDEAKLILKDLTWSFRENVLDAYKPGVIYLDAHPYYLLRNVIEEVLKESAWILAIHDCSKGLCNPLMTLSKAETNITSETGVWERHVLAEVFGVSNPLSPKLDEVQTSTHRLNIFDTPHGLGLLLPNQLLADTADR